MSKQSRSVEENAYLFVLRNTESNEIVFQGRLKPAFCRYEISDGAVCGRDSTLHVELCKEHLRLVGLEIKPARDPKMGLGLFAVGDPDEIVFAPRGNKFRVPHRIVNYNGQKLTHEQFVERYGLVSSPFAMRLNSKTIIDPALVRGTGSYMNHTSKQFANCRYSASSTGVSIVADSVIRGGDELMACYNATRGDKSYRGFFSESTSYETKLVFVGSLPRIFCYCQREEDSDLYVKCSSSSCWHSNGWVHAKCAGVRRDKIPLVFTCRDCEQDDFPLGVSFKAGLKLEHNPPPNSKNNPPDEGKNNPPQENPPAKGDDNPPAEKRNDPSVWCYCQREDDGSLYIECSGGSKCPVSGWVHAACADFHTSSIPEVFTCKYCVTVVHTSSQLARLFTSKGHEAMVADAVRNKAFESALACAKQQGLMRVFDIGTGPKAFLSMLAVKQGLEAAGVEADPKASSLADKLLRPSGFVRNFLGQDPQTSALIKEFKPDVIMCELIGFLASGEGMPLVMKSVQAAANSIFFPSVISTFFVLSDVKKEDMRNSDVSSQFALVKRLNFDSCAMSDGHLLEEYDFSGDLQLVQTRKETIKILKVGTVNSLSFWIRADFPCGKNRSYTGDCTCARAHAGDRAGGPYPHFTSKYGDQHAASNWRNMVLWLREPIDASAGDSVNVEAGVDATNFPSKYLFKVTHGRVEQEIVLEDLFPHMRPSNTKSKSVKMVRIKETRY